jgi:L-cystine uptake protein TcyP (sodium:dicarboxylate symporter family)
MIISLGIAGIPGTATVSTVTLLISMGLPTAAYAALVPMEQLVDPARTMANVNSALANAIIVDKVVSISDKRAKAKAAKKSTKKA